MWSKGTLGSTWTTNAHSNSIDEEECNTTRDGGGGTTASSEEDEMTYESSSRAMDADEERSMLGEAMCVAEQSQSVDDDDGQGTWICHPYKVEMLEQQLFQNSPGSTRRNAVIETLRQVGVKVFVIDSKSTDNTKDVVDHIKRVVGFVARENCVVPKNGPLGFQRCLLYQDEEGRLFNLMLSKHAVGPAGTWQELLDSFSGCEAMMAITVLCRSLPCIVNSKKEKMFLIDFACINLTDGSQNVFAFQKTSRKT